MATRRKPDRNTPERRAHSLSAAATAESTAAADDPISRFVAECLAPQPGSHVSMQEVFALYSAWAVARDQIEWHATYLNRELTSRGFVLLEGGGVNRWRGMRCLKRIADFQDERTGDSARLRDMADRMELPPLPGGSDAACRADGRPFGAPPLDLGRVGELTGQGVMVAAERAAKDVEAASDTMMTLASDIDVQCKQLAAAIVESAAAVKAQIDAFTAKAQETALSLREARERFAMKTIPGGKS